jgi:SP family sugar:H+ symporter-like MFS transporter
MTATYQLFITFGILVAYCISLGSRSISGSGSWQTVVGIGIIWPGILAFGIQLMPEVREPWAKPGYVVFSICH